MRDDRSASKDTDFETWLREAAHEPARDVGVPPPCPRTLRQRIA